MDIEGLRLADSYHDLALLFGISPPVFSKAIYGSSDGYIRFEIAKKNGTFRAIESPTGIRRRIQKMLAPVLDQGYKPNAHAHGFISKRSILTNATPHIGKRVIVNIDLLDFFNTISFKRVRGVLLASPFNVSWRVANILAQAICCDGRLPAGGITSPTISNIALARFDKRFAGLAARFGGNYTRYADDITMSFDRSISQIQGVANRDDTGSVSIGSQAIQIIEEEGFSPNLAKFRAAESSSRKIVTGIVVNKISNVRRQWIRDLDSTVHAMKKFGVESVAQRLIPEFSIEVSSALLLRRIHGRIAYLYMVRGHGDWIASDLANKFNSLSDNSRLKVPDTELISQSHRVTRGLLVVTASNTTPPITDWESQGTGFITKDGLIVTANHVVQYGSGHFSHIQVRSCRKPAVRFECNVVAFDAHRDIAILRLASHNSELLRSRLLLGSSVSVGQRVSSLGFPAYSFGHEYSRQEHEVNSTRTTSGVGKFVTTGNIYSGYSGGPVVDAQMKVVGVIHRGAVGGGHSNEIVSVDDLRIVLASV